MSEDYWYAPEIIRYTRRQMIWGIDNLITLKEGNWPKRPDSFLTDTWDKEKGKWVEVWLKPSSGIDPSILSPISHHASYEQPILFAAEIEERLKSTKEAGEALIDEIESGIIDYESLCGPAKRALNYICGRKRRRMTYSAWNRQGRYRGEPHINIALEILKGSRIANGKMWRDFQKQYDIPADIPNLDPEVVALWVGQWIQSDIKSVSPTGDYKKVIAHLKRKGLLDK